MVLLSVKKRTKKNSSICRKGGDNNEKKTCNACGRAFGTMLLGLPDDPNLQAKALQYLRAQPNITVEEVQDHHA